METRASEQYDQPMQQTRANLDFGGALVVLRQGGAVSRLGWNGLNQRLHLQRPDSFSKMTLPYIYIVTVGGARVPWLASQTDLLSVDWFEVPLKVHEK